MLDNLHFEGLLDVAKLLREGAITSSALTEMMLDRIAAIDPVLKSYAYVSRERALEQAARADRELAAGVHRGPLHGVPVAVKDLCYTTYAPTAAGTIVHDGFTAPYNATVVNRLEMVGAVMLGKLTMTEGAYTSHHPKIPAPLNPWGHGSWPGASSTGSGVAPAAGLTFGALGSDTGGSIRLPSAACGLSGIKPTWGRVSRHGTFALADTMDHIGPMTRSVADSAAMLQAIAGWDANDPTSIDAAVPDYLAELGLGVRGMRIGLDRDYAFAVTHPEVAAALEMAVDVFQSLGARIVDVKFPPFLDVVNRWNQMCSVETAAAHASAFPGREDDYGPALRFLIEEGQRTSGVDVAVGLQHRLAFTEALATMFGQVDCMLIPAIPMPVPRLEQLERLGEDAELLAGLLRFTCPFDFSGTPTITLPNGFDPAGMPISMQLAGPRLGEAALIGAGHAFQTQTDWHTRHPADPR